MTINEFSLKYQISYNWVHTALWEAKLLQRWKKNHEYDELEMCVAVIEYLSSREKAHEEKVKEFKDFRMKIAYMMP